MIYCETDDYILYKGDMREELQSIESNSIDSIVTDPPYELGFMGKSWDSSGVAFNRATWEECLRVLKPGGYMLAFGGTRTYHRICCAIEDAGFEIRDCIMWLYGSGFPKSMNVGLAMDKKNGVETEIIGYEEISMPNFQDQGRKNVENGGLNKIGATPGVSGSERKAQPIYNCTNSWAGWGTTLKPAYEPIIVARKPLEGSTLDNCEKWGVGAINIDDCRVPLEDNYVFKTSNRSGGGRADVFNDGSCEFDSTKCTEASVPPMGRFPSNVITDGSDEVAKGFPFTKSTGGKGEKSIASGLSGSVYQGGWSHQVGGDHLGGLGDEGSAMRYFYCAKASKKDRDEGVIDRNIHPSVKPATLMQYLVRLVSPKGATILDPFMGSGSTGKATMLENVERNAHYKFVGIEMTEDYLPIAKARIDFGAGYDCEEPVTETEEFEKQPISKKVFLW